MGASTARAQALPPGVQDVVKLSQAGISDEVILTQIRNNAAIYNLTADQIILLKNQGVSQPVIKALLTGGAAAIPSRPAPSAPLHCHPRCPGGSRRFPPAAPAPAVSLDSFQPQLAPYGAWIQVPGYGLCWQPTVAVSDPAWRPYFNQGHWIYTDTGWSWQSDYPWGGIVFHYGRWSRSWWVWVPGYDWAPAWVCWRKRTAIAAGAIAARRNLSSLALASFSTGKLALDVDFGLGMDDFTFVAYDHFWDNNLRLF